MNFLSIDPGKNVSISCWKDNKLSEVVKWEFDESNFHSHNIANLIELVSQLISKIGAEAVVSEKPGRKLAIQITMFYDLRLLAQRRKIDFVPFGPTHVKKVVFGNGRASKEDMTTALLFRKIGGSSKKIQSLNEHEVDSICIGLCFLEDLGRKSKGKKK